MKHLARAIHLVSWWTMAVLLLVGGSAYVRPAEIGRSFGTSYVAVTDPLALGRPLPTSYKDELEKTYGGKVGWFTYAPSGQGDHDFEIMAFDDDALGSVVDGAWQWTLIGPPYFELDPTAVDGWRHDPHGFLASYTLALEMGWKLGDTIELPEAECGEPLSGVVRGFVRGTVGDRVIVHYGHLEARRAGCPHAGHAHVIELEVPRADQERIAAEIDARFATRNAPTVSAPVDVFYRDRILSRGLERLSSWGGVAIGLAALFALAFLLVGSISPAPARWVLAVHGAAVVGLVALYLRFHQRGLRLPVMTLGDWGLDNVVLLAKPLVGTLLATTLLAVSYPILVAALGRVRAHLASPKSPFFAAVALLAGGAIALCTGEIEGVDLALASLPNQALSSITAMPPSVERAKKVVDDLRAWNAAAAPGEARCAWMTLERDYVWRNRKGERVRFALDTTTAIDPRCAIGLRTAQPASRTVADPDGRFDLADLPIGDEKWPVLAVPLGSSEGLSSMSVFVDLDDLLGSHFDVAVEGVIYGHALPPALAEAPREPWSESLHQIIRTATRTGRWLELAALVWLVAAWLVASYGPFRARAGWLALGAVAGVLLAVGVARIVPESTLVTHWGILRHGLVVGRLALASTSAALLALLPFCVAVSERALRVGPRPASPSGPRASGDRRAR